MKIVRNTPEQLIIRSVPWFWGVVFGGLILMSLAYGLNALAIGDGKEAFWALIGLPAFLSIFLFAFVRRDDLILDRSRNRVELRHSTFRGRRKIRHELRHLERALVQTNNTDGSATHRPALVLNGGMDAGTHPLTPVYTSGRGAERAVEAINAWLGGR